MTLDKLKHGRYYYDPITNDVIYFGEYSDNFYWFNSCSENYSIAYRESEIANLKLY